MGSIGIFIGTTSFALLRVGPSEASVLGCFEVVTAADAVQFYTLLLLSVPYLCIIVYGLKGYGNSSRRKQSLSS